jgi:hypothetical protein
MASFGEFGTVTGITGLTLIMPYSIMATSSYAYIRIWWASERFV